jgi:hypothetical protein
MLTPVIPADTSPEAFAVQARLFRRLGPSERLRRTMEMCDEARALCDAGVRRRHPEFGAGQVREEVTRIVLEVSTKFS